MWWCCFDDEDNDDDENAIDGAKKMNKIKINKFQAVSIHCRMKALAQPCVGNKQSGLSTLLKGTKSVKVVVSDRTREQIIPPSIRGKAHLIFISNYTFLTRRPQHVDVQTQKCFYN